VRVTAHGSASMAAATLMLYTHAMKPVSTAGRAQCCSACKDETSTNSCTCAADAAVQAAAGRLPNDPQRPVAQGLVQITWAERCDAATAELIGNIECAWPLPLLADTPDGVAAWVELADLAPARQRKYESEFFC
jgi:hypothetical protein